MSIARMKRVGREDRKKRGIPHTPPKSLYPSTVTRVKNPKEDREATKQMDGFYDDAPKPVAPSANPGAMRGKTEAELAAKAASAPVELTDEEKARKSISISESVGIEDMGAKEELAERQAAAMGESETVVNDDLSVTRPGSSHVDLTAALAEVVHTEQHFSGLTVKELKAFAEDYEIDLDKQLTKKADIVDFIAKAFEARVLKAHAVQPWGMLMQKTMDYYTKILDSVTE